MKMKTSTCITFLSVMALFILLGLHACSSEEINPEDEAPLSFSTPGFAKATSVGGMAEILITASGGMMPYEFYVIPETQWSAGDQMYEMLLQNNFSRLYRYTYERNFIGTKSYSIEVLPGTTASPRYYWVCVQDKAENATISGTNLLSWWKRIAAYPFVQN